MVENQVKSVKIIFVLPKGEEIEVDATLGLSLLEVTKKHSKLSESVEGACEGALACSTCHMIVDEPFYNTLPEASDEEEDMLDLAFGVKKTSRLGCQVIVTKDLDGMRVALPSETRNIML